MQLLERGYALEALERCGREARAGEGRIAVVGGEAGIGKTSLVEQFAAVREERVLWGRCDPLFTPAPLSPFRDIAAELGADGFKDVEPRTETGVFGADLLRRVQLSRPVIVVIEDLHWADEATLDAIKHLARRPHALEILVVLTYRDDELALDHPLHSALAVLATCRIARRITLAPLSLEAVRSLVRDRDIDAAAVHRRTSGNPFLVAELLATDAADRVPDAVREIALQRAARLPGPARNVLDAAAVIGPRVDARLLWRMLGEDAAHADACIAAGLLRAEVGALVIRHELTRQAVLSSISPPRRAMLHARALAAMLEAGETDPSVLAHHAEEAGDAEAVRAHAPAAARLARAAGSHREAADQIARALRHAAPGAAEERALLLEAYSVELAFIDRQSAAADARREAAAAWRALGNTRKEGENLAALAWPLVRSGLNAQADESCRRALAILGKLGPGPELAAAMRMQAHLRMLDRDKRAAVRWGRKAIAMSEAIGDVETLASAHMVVGAAMLVEDDARGRSYLDRSVALSRKHGFDGLVALAYLNMGSSYGEQYRFEDADECLRRCIELSTRRDLGHAEHYASAWLALTRLHQGRWREAGEIASDVLRTPDVAVVSRIMALVALGRLGARRGDPGARHVLDEALELASGTGTLQRLAPVRAARSEAASLSGDRARARDEAEAAWALACARRHAWHTGELAFWRAQAGAPVDAPTWAALPYRLQLMGDWKAAAAAWAERGCPYERARALAEGDGSARREALEVFDRLGAGPAADRLRRRLRSEGAGRVPRGPRPATRMNPLGLTPRQAEIAALLREPLTNAQIARRLRISAKTVDHHVSAVLGKLGVSSRSEVAQAAAELRADVGPRNRRI